MCSDHPRKVVHCRVEVQRDACQSQARDNGALQLQRELVEALSLLQSHLRRVHLKG